MLNLIGYQGDYPNRSLHLAIKNPETRENIEISIPFDEINELLVPFWECVSQQISSNTWKELLIKSDVNAILDYIGDNKLDLTNGISHIDREKYKMSLAASLFLKEKWV